MLHRTLTLQEASKDHRWQQEMGSTMVPLLLSQLKAAEAQTVGPLVMVDYGCVDGYISMFAFHTALKEFRKTSARPVVIYHTNTPGNDWNLFYETMNNSAYAQYRLDDVYILSASSSSFMQICPENQVHIGFSAFSMNILTKFPERVTPEIALRLPECQEQLIADITQNLTIRLRELAVGGTITVLIHGTFENNPLENILVEPIKRLAAKGIVTESEAKKFMWVAPPLSKQEWERIFKNLETKAEVKLFEIVRIVCPQYKEYLQNGDLEAYKRNLANNFGGTMRFALNRCLERDEEGIEEIAKLCFEETKDLIDGSELSANHTTVVLQKI